MPFNFFFFFNGGFRGVLLFTQGKTNPKVRLPARVRLCGSPTGRKRRVNALWVGPGGGRDGEARFYTQIFFLKIFHRPQKIENFFTWAPKN